MKIDIFTHILPAKYKKLLYNKATSDRLLKVNDATPTLTDLDLRFRIMDKFDDYVQVLTLASPAVESVVGPKDAVELAKLANDEMAELVYKYPDRFVAAVACLPMSDVEAAVNEAERAIRELGFKGVQIYTDVNGKPIDLPEFMSLYELMAKYDLPIFIHPKRGPTIADYPSEDRSRYLVWTVFGWPFETTVAMTRIVFSGLLAKYPRLKFITHHCGGMVSFFSGRIASIYDFNATRMGYRYRPELTKHPLEYFRMFYADTAVCAYDTTPALECAYSFFGPEHLLFGTDMPFDSQIGYRAIAATIYSIEAMDIDEGSKKLIFSDNIRKLLRLPV